jgi:hypothetical protein
VFEICTAAIPKTIKLYGQITPNKYDGGCQLGLLRDEYHPGELFTQIPEPTA